MTNLRISKRLGAAAALCRDNAFIADVGTDHAYLPIYLLQNNKIRGGVVSDINKGPIERAKDHICEYGAADKLTPVLCDGLAPLESFSPEDIFILGMGGELIAKIISEADFTKKKGVRLILQPMTHPELLRKFLTENGYRIVKETLVEEEKIYQILAAEYSGEITVYNQTELLFGKQNIASPTPLFYKLLDRTQKVMLDRIEPKRAAGADTSEEENLLKQIGELR